MIRFYYLFAWCSLLSDHTIGGFVPRETLFRSDVRYRFARTNKVNDNANRDTSPILYNERSNPSYLRLKSSVVDTTTANAINGANAEESYELNVIGTITFLLPSQNSERSLSKFGASSPYGCPSIDEAVEHLSQKSYVWSDGTVKTKIVYIPTGSGEDVAKITNQLASTDVLIAMGLQSESDLAYASSVFQERLNRPIQLRQRQCQFNLDSTSMKMLPSFVGPYDEESPSLIAKLFPWTKVATAKRLYEQMNGLFDRWTSDDFCYAVMIFLNQFSGSSVDWVKHSIDATWEKGPIRNVQEIYAMVNKCGDCVVDCVKDEKCRECITKLTEIDSRDQVTSYRTIVSFESELLRDFSQCILTRNNIFDCDAKIPTLPKVNPIKSFRGAPVTEEIARALLVGHLDDEAALDGSFKRNMSWIVACGANVAYDQFPSQNQIFYPASRGRDMWYDPVFRVNTLDGRSVWCTRHYKVRPQKDIGTFRFSVLDNGVTSDEFWTIVGAANDLSWIVFHYAGAAKAVGQQYLGGLLCTPDGSIPTESLPVIWECLRSAGIQPWELYEVDNRRDTPSAIEAGPPPLDLYRSAILAKKETATTEE